MLELILIRHAHAGPHIEPDFERNLSERGKAEAIKSAQVMKYSNHLPGHWIISSAQRTRETATILTDTLPELAAKMDFHLELYEAPMENYLPFIENAAMKTVYLVGHNPTISRMASHFSNQFIVMETGDIVHLRWENLDNWEEINFFSAEIVYHYIPKFN